MKQNEILEEIHRFRAEHARECGGDIHTIFNQIRAGTEKLKAEGWQVVSFGEPAEVSYALHDRTRKEN